MCYLYGMNSLTHDDPTTATAGDRVAYEDMANPLSHATVADVETTEWGTSFVLAWDDGCARRLAGGDAISTATLRGAGWRLVERRGAR